MRKSILAVFGGVVLAGLSASAIAQATFETLMTHSMSTAVGTQAGTVLGRATNALANRAAQQTATATSHVTSPAYTPRRAGATKTRATQTSVPATAAIAPSSGNGSLIASIQGGEPRARGCTATAKTAAGSQNVCAVEASQASEHPAVVNLPAAK